MLQLDYARVTVAGTGASALRNCRGGVSYLASGNADNLANVVLVLCIAASFKRRSKPLHCGLVQSVRIAAFNQASKVISKGVYVSIRPILVFATSQVICGRHASTTKVFDVT